jgi:DNA polymerase delta subunit 2
MPGANDPANVALPQQPIHVALFERTKAYIPSMFECVTNPAWWDVDGVRIFGTSGQNLEDIYMYAEEDHVEGGRVALLEKMLRWRHCAPTAPDTLCSPVGGNADLGCYPFKDRDPFVMEETPNVFFAGNQPEYASRLVRGSAIFTWCNCR